jgi:hypothetical protein
MHGFTDPDTGTDCLETMVPAREGMAEIRAASSSTVHRAEATPSFIDLLALREKRG